MGKITVDGTDIQVLQFNEDDYISLTDMVRNIENGSALMLNGIKLLFIRCLY